jgi:hypothetical protein
MGRQMDLEDTQEEPFRDEARIWLRANRAEDPGRDGLALVRTDPEAPPHQGITFVAIDMRSEGVEARPAGRYRRDLEELAVARARGLDRDAAARDRLGGLAGLTADLFERRTQR